MVVVQKYIEQLLVINFGGGGRERGRDKVVLNLFKIEGKGLEFASIFYLKNNTN